MVALIVFLVDDGYHCAFLKAGYLHVVALGETMDLCCCFPEVPSYKSLGHLFSSDFNSLVFFSLPGPEHGVL